MVQVFLTIILIAAGGAWVISVQRKLSFLRNEVKAAWKLLEVDQSNSAVRAVYNNHVTTYNAALEEFPANVFGPMGGFKPARMFTPQTPDP